MVERDAGNCVHVLKPEHKSHPCRRHFISWLEKYQTLGEKETEFACPDTRLILKLKPYPAAAAPLRSGKNARHR
jgi:hypothetical protein